MHEKTQNRLFLWTVLFLFIQSTILTISPAVRERTWNVDYRFSHWIGFFVWLGLIIFSNQTTSKRLPERDPFLLPAAFFLSGWGMLTIWRLDESFGLRQTIWLAISICVFNLAVYVPKNLQLLRQYKYILLTSGLLITALTLIFGTNPLGIGPRLWLGCCGVYFQPSEPLKLLLVIYLSAYLADRAGVRLSTIPLLIPTLVVTGLALLLLLVQRDLGTASIFISIFTIVLFLATGKRRIILGAIFILSLALFTGYFYIDIIQIRLDGWINPWTDPSGNSYQIVQSLLAVANGGIFGRGYGIGSPLLVPVSISDFIFSAIAEETGLVGTVGLLALIWLILSRGLIVSLRATDRFRRYLAAGVVTYIGFQSLLIIGGNLRLMPLTGVTLPFVSYGGSSLLTSFIALYILLVISNLEDSEPAQLPDPNPYSLLAGILGLGLAACALASLWWAVVRAPDLLGRTDNPRRSIADRFVLRGKLVDHNNQPINVTVGESGSYERVYLYPELAPITGYTHPIFGQAGLEASLDSYLRGLQGNPSSLIWWDHMLYGTPPPGLDVRLSLDIALQTKADDLLGSTPGAIVLMNAETGEILAMASHPIFDPNKLDEEGEGLSRNSSAPLLNRATQGLYPVGDILSPIIKAEFGSKQPSESEMRVFYGELGLNDAPDINMPVASNPEIETSINLKASPLQISIGAAALSNHGTTPTPKIAIAVNTPEQGWVVLSAETKSNEVIQAISANKTAQSLVVEGKPFWTNTSTIDTNETTVTWLISGTLPDWTGTPLVLVITIEENNIPLAEKIRNSLIAEALNQ